jgi:hypothetical protein
VPRPSLKVLVLAIKAVPGNTRNKYYRTRSMSAHPQQTYSTKNKLFGTAFIAIIPGFWSMLAIAMCWETVSLNCSPSPVEVICKISGEPNPGEMRMLEVPKAQLAEVAVIDRSTRPIRYRIGLITTDRQKIPLTRNFSGDATTQLEQQIDRISTFIADPTATNLTIETRRNFPLSIWIISGVIFGFSGWYLKRLWIGHQS